MLKRVTATLLLCVMAGCMTVGPNYQRPKVEVAEAWQGEVGAPVPAQWWRSYNDPVLDRMVDEALAHNNDLAAAMARVEEAQAALGIARADRLPGVTANAGATRNRISERSALAFPGQPLYYNDLTATLRATWEIDFWGKYRRADEAARADLLAARWNREAIRLALIAQVAQSYFNLRALDAQVTVTRETIGTRQSSLELQRLRLNAGLASQFEIDQLQAETAAAQALLPSLETQLAQQETALGVLLGRSPRALVQTVPDRGAAIEALAVPPAVPSGLPSHLLERRPDLREAEERLIAANARIGVARAAYYPSISLTGLLGVESASLSNLFRTDAIFWQAGGSLAQTVFDAGRTKSQVGVATARQKQTLAQYQSTLQNAFRDTLDALVAQRKANETLQAEQTRVTSLTSALQLAKMRYERGIASQLDVLDAERGLLDAQLNRVTAQRVQLSASADLYKALGGGWTAEGVAAD